MGNFGIRLSTLSLLALLSTGCNFSLRVAPLADSSSLVVAILVNPLSYNPDSDERQIPFEHDLLIRLAKRLQKTLEVVPLRTANEVVEYVATGQAHLGAAWLTPSDDRRVLATEEFHRDEITLVQQDPSVPIESIGDLSGKTIHVAAGSIAAGVVERLRSKRLPSLTVIVRPDGSGIGLLRSVANQEIELTAASGELASIAQNYFPEMIISAPLSATLPIVWLTENRPGNDVAKTVNEFLAEITADGSLARLNDAHFSFRRRLTQSDATQFIEKVTMVLPEYQGLFKQAQIRSDIDWRLIAALAYQESKWDPNATSPTNVRGIMMLTEETADHLGVSNRLNAKESILAGADYLASLRDQLPDSIEEPDRTWMALAAYNLGMGHLRGGRLLAPGYKLNPDSWYDMKKMLPKLSRPEVYERLKSGRARGGEAVILVENVRAYYDILSRHTPSYSALVEAEPEKPQQLAGKKPGLKPPPKAQTAAISIAPRM